MDQRRDDNGPKNVRLIPSFLRQTQSFRASEGILRQKRTGYLIDNLGWKILRTFVSI